MSLNSDYFFQVHVEWIVCIFVDIIYLHMFFIHTQHSALNIVSICLIICFLLVETKKKKKKEKESFFVSVLLFFLHIEA